MTRIRVYLEIFAQRNYELVAEGYGLLEIFIDIMYINTYSLNAKCFGVFKQ